MLLTKHPTGKTAASCWPNILSMSRFFFQVHANRCLKYPVIENELSGIGAARKTALDMFADLARDITADLSKESEWQLEVTDASGKPVFSLKVIAQSPKIWRGNAIEAALLS
jgi:hypothetical protein